MQFFRILAYLGKARLKVKTAAAKLYRKIQD
jgi:hypothetical protein